MNRRDFLVTASAAGLTLPALPALAAIGTPYREGLVDAELAAGKTVFLDFYAEWCTTCRAQERAMTALLSAEPAYRQSISFFAIDWDQHARSDLATRLNIPRRSTLVVLKGDQELGRLVAVTNRSQIKALLDTALSAATA